MIHPFSISKRTLTQTLNKDILKVSKPVSFCVVGRQEVSGVTSRCRQVSGSITPATATQTRNHCLQLVFFCGCCCCCWLLQIELLSKDTTSASCRPHLAHAWHWFLPCLTWISLEQPTIVFTLPTLLQKANSSVVEVQKWLESANVSLPVYKRAPNATTHTCGFYPQINDMGCRPAGQWSTHGQSDKALWPDLKVGKGEGLGASL